MHAAELFSLLVGHFFSVISRCHVWTQTQTRRCEIVVGTEGCTVLYTEPTKESRLLGAFDQCNSDSRQRSLRHVNLRWTTRNTIQRDYHLVSRPSGYSLASDTGDVVAAMLQANSVPICLLHRPYIAGHHRLNLSRSHSALTEKSLTAMIPQLLVSPRTWPGSTTAELGTRFLCHDFQRGRGICD